MGQGSNGGEGDELDLPIQISIVKAASTQHGRKVLHACCLFLQEPLNTASPDQVTWMCTGRKNPTVALEINTPSRCLSSTVSAGGDKLTCAEEKASWD